MNIVYCHIDYSLSGRFRKDRYSQDFLPEYAVHSMLQSRFVSSASQQFLVCNPQKITEWAAAAIQAAGVRVVEQDSLMSDKIACAADAYAACSLDAGLQNFNFVTMARLFFVEELMKKFGLSDVLHLEYDNLLYAGEDEISGTLTGDYMVSKVNDGSLCAGIAFFKTYQTLSEVNKQLIDEMLQKPDCYIAEMYLLARIAKYNKNIGFFRWCPNETGYVYDPNSYGLFLCGTNQGDPPGYIDKRHDCGRFISVNRDRISFFRSPAMGFEIDGRKHRFVNLHIHNKRAIGGMVSYS